MEDDANNVISCRVNSLFIRVLQEFLQRLENRSLVYRIKQNSKCISVGYYSKFFYRTTESISLYDLVQRPQHTLRTPDKSIFLFPIHHNTSRQTNLQPKFGHLKRQANEADARRSRRQHPPRKFEKTLARSSSNILNCALSAYTCTHTRAQCNGT